MSHMHMNVLKARSPSASRPWPLYHKGVDEERSVRGDTRHSDSRDNLNTCTKQQNTGYVPTTLVRVGPDKSS